MTSLLKEYSLYIHIPWCVKKCPYCDFNSHEQRGDYNEEHYIAALIRDLKTETEHIEGRKLKSIFIGGGTPSLFSASSIDTLLSAVHQHLHISDDIEITLEANPGTAEAEKFNAFRQVGINRLSIGIQSFNDEHLRKLGRIHDAEQAHRAITLAKSAGFKRINLDLMFGLPDQSIDQAISDVTQALHYETGHISHYQLTLEKNTLFYKQPPTLPTDDSIWAMQTACQRQLATQLDQYEVSAYAANQQASKHNLNYWQFGDYIGIGAGAHGKITDNNANIYRYWKTKHPRNYMETAGLSACVGGKTLIPADERPFEFMLNALRLKSGFTLQQFEQHTLLSAKVIEPTLSNLLDKKLLQIHDSDYVCTEQGWNFLNDTIEHFLPA